MITLNHLLEYCHDSLMIYYSDNMSVIATFSKCYIVDIGNFKYVCKYLWALKLWATIIADIS